MDKLALQDSLIAKAELITGEKEFFDPQKVGQMIQPSNDVTCSTDDASALGDRYNRLKSGTYTTGGDLQMVFVDMLIPLRYISSCTGDFDGALPDLVMKLLAFRAAITKYRLPLPESTLQQIEATYLDSNKSMGDSIALLPPDMRETVNESLKLSLDEINHETVTTKFGGKVPYLLIFYPAALNKAVSLIKGDQDLAKTIKDAGDSGNITISSSDEESGSSSSKKKGDNYQDTILIAHKKHDDKEEVDIGKIWNSVTKNSFVETKYSSGRVRYRLTSS